ncbi:MAG: hypothetical protein ACKOPG_04735, partial [Novosphingobium sp.]
DGRNLLCPPHADQEGGLKHGQGALPSRASLVKANVGERSLDAARIPDIALSQRSFDRSGTPPDRKVWRARIRQSALHHRRRERGNAGQAGQLAHDVS